ncbi:MAG: hypothetical protein HYY02_12740 [Chloroflexi bacterium]|nr:hypothetical protein [Chloroflexota bacterium]
MVRIFWSRVKVRRAAVVRLLLGLGLVSALALSSATLTHAGNNDELGNARDGGKPTETCQWGTWFTPSLDGSGEFGGWTSCKYGTTTYIRHSLTLQAQDPGAGTWVTVDTVASECFSYACQTRISRASLPRGEYRVQYCHEMESPLSVWRWHCHQERYTVA